MTGQRGRIQSRAARKDAPAVKRGRVLVPQLTGQTACRARDTRQPPAEAPPRGTAGDVSAAAGQAGEQAAAVARMFDGAQDSYGGFGLAAPGMPMRV
jgi:hypothetical protein